MKIIIAGGRDFSNYRLLLDTMSEYFGTEDPEDLTIISGRAKGADALGEHFAHALRIKTELFPADWDTHGKTAGFKRNIEMAKAATHLVAFWDKKSKGTKHMIDQARKHNLQTIVVHY